MVESVRDVFNRLSSPVLISTVAVALSTAWVIALFTPSWWIAGLLAFTIGAGALAGATDRHIAELCARGWTRIVPALGPFVVLRFFSAALAIVSGVSFVLLGAGALMGSIGAGG